MGHFFSGTARSCTHTQDKHVSLNATCCCSTGNSDTYTCQYALRELSRTHAHAHIHTRSVPSVLLSVPVQEVVCDSNEVDTVDVGTWRLFPRHIAPIQTSTHSLWSKWIKLKMLDVWKAHTLFLGVFFSTLHMPFKHLQSSRYCAKWHLKCNVCRKFTIYQSKRKNKRNYPGIVTSEEPWLYMTQPENSNSPINHYPCFSWAFILLSFPSHKGNKWKYPRP